MANTSNYKQLGGSRWVIGGSLDVASGGEIDVESGGSLKIAGTAVTASAAELNELASRETVFAVTSTLTIAQVNAGATIIPAVTGKTLRILDYKLVSTGSMTQLTAIVLQDTNTSPVVVTTVAAAGLTNGTIVHPFTATHVTNGAGFLASLTASKGLALAKTGSTETTATGLKVYVVYSYV